ncbi:uncharacterized protein lgals4 isoform X10 [Myxocyprinus asiaticus]|uniref:uncharacterized protein lgals4 isoform X7 n=1 Tax=Myxocyprinus asiaticus TaxID=70543 RepID=UPI002222D985|nr:uncharacterized protein lgals4 isoform X7 [Myxocyprinus asiaticus]XP_051512881.1 uncharacterized protein lgals4 isoform X10 [Myxocyprinus asiaticus]
MSFVFQSGFQSGFQSDFQAISSLSVPYVSPVSGGLRAGEAILIQGAVPSVCESFVVSLKCGESEGDDIAFQIKPQFSSNCMVLNSRLKGLWGNEKKLALPLKKGNNFDLIIAINSENYQVYLNGCEVGQFQHSIPLKGVTALHIGGDVTLTNVVFMGNWTGSSNFGQGEMMTMKSFGKHSSAQKGSWTFECGSFQTTQATNLTGTKTVHPEIKLPVTNLVQNPALPYVGPVAGGLRAGMALYLQGVVPTNADQFAINFKTGQSDKDDIAFHFNPRMGSKVAMNSFRNGGWQTEESASENPFKKGDAFEMFIVPKPEGYQVCVNGKEHYMFKHRIPLENVKALNILGHVAAKLFGFIENWSIPSFTKEAKTTVTSLGSSHWGLSPTQSEVLHPVQNPILPYVGTIPGGLRAGMALYLQGVVPTNADQFAINFKTGQSDKDDIAFHFNPRMGSKVAMNSFRNGGWQTEESASENPFKKGDAFEMFIVPKPEGYQVYVNGKEHYMFKHRIPLENVKALNILGHVAAKLFGYIENWSIPSFTKEAKTTVSSLGSSHWGLSPTQSEVLHPVQNPILPYVGTIPGGLRAGMALYLQGVVSTNADLFAINFKTGQSDKDDIAFHFNPRMGSKVAMNSFRNGGWQTEESASENPFKKGDAFEMFIVPKPEGYQVYVNGKEHYMFKHRIPLEKVTSLNILGHVAAKLFGFIENWSIPSFTKEAKTTVTSLGSSHWGLSPTQSEVLHPVQNPILPYVGTIPGGLRAGMALYLQGVVPTNADQFAINFKTGQSDKDDIAFHFSPRMGSKVAMNSFRNGGWQTEESASENPFKKGDAFEMFIVPKPEGYQVYVNGKEHYMFKHRIPLENVKALNILGHIAAKLFGFIENWSIPSFTKEAKTTVTSLGSSHWGLSPTQSEVLHPVQNPILPYVGTIPGGLRAGMALYLQGVVPTNADQFAINFKTGQSDKDDIAFHFNPRMGSKVAMNSFRNGGWQTEESASENPFKKGDAFEMFIVPKPEGYQVYVNGKEHYMFKHRIPLENVKALNILGHVAAKLFGFIENWSIPSFTNEAKTTVTSLGSSHWGLSPTQSEVLHPVQNPILPYVGTIPGGLRAGMALYLQGVVPTNADQFAINFKTGQSDKDDIAFHFNPRMGSKVAMNSFRNGGWQTEESASENPFKKGDAFEMFIVPKPEGYQVYVNGKEHYMFKHRIPLENVKALNILGHVAAKLFGFIENWSIPSFTKEAKTTVTSLGSSHWGLSPTQSEVLHPVQNPILPYVGTIPGGLRAGMAMYLQGVVPTNADQFAINFKTGQSDKDDIAFHFNPRMGSKVAMNSFRNGGWQTEESASENPFKKGDAFEMFIVPKPEGYQVFVNGKEHYMFKHRIPLEKVTSLNILGHIAAKLFGFIENWRIPSFTKEAKTTITSLSSSHWGLSPTQSEVLHPVQNPILPYVGTIPGGLRAGMALYLQGVVPTNADQFAINFQTGQSDKDDIAFHFNPRIGSKVAMNSFRNGGWQTEESASENPFKKGDAFEMFIVPKPEGYQVYVNGKEHYMFKHRIPLENVKALNILGHIAAKLFGFIENWSIPSFNKEAKTTVTSLGSSHWGLSPTQSEVLHPVQNPILPYVGTIPGGLRAGMALYLQGVVPTNADQFAINFKTGQSDKDDIAFHFNPRMGSKVAMNSFRNGGWQTEESASENPFKKGDAFEMFIVPKPEGYQVYVNGKEHYMFKHRIPLENVKALNILGHVAAKLFGFIENWSIPSFTKEAKTTVTSLGSSHWGLSPTQSEVLHPVQNPILPYVGTIPGGLRAGMALYLQGVVPTNADQFAINFKTGQSDKDDIAFHFNPRMGSKVAMNSFRNGGWQTEESASENPFKKGDAFEMFIVPKPEGYQVYVNGKEHYMFKHRIPLENVKALNILGHVAAKLFGFIENWSIPSFTKEAKTTVTSLGRSHWGLSPTQSEVLHPVQNPILPYVGTIPGGLRAGMALYLQGVVPTNADQFAINFKTGQSDKDDIAFHFNPRMGSKMAMNSFRNGGWQTEESASENPFKKGDAFEMFIVPKPEGYQVFVNGKEHYMFKHRIPLEKVTSLNILGHIAAKLFGFIENWRIPSFTKEAKTTITSLSSSHWGLSPTQSEVLHPVQNPILPYVGTIPGGLRAGMALYLQGVVPTNADQFAINFQTGQSDKDDIAFHFNPRMGSKVAMNSFRNGGWQTEESASENPFKKGDAFEMFIVPKPEGYQVYVNGKEHYMFKHRVPLEKVSALHINGNVALNFFGFIENWSISSFTKEAKTTITSLGSTHWSLSTIQSEILHPVHSPTLPYVGPIAGGLRAGMALYMQGVVAHNADRFSINFKTGQSDKDDIAFHFNPRMGNKVIMNSFRKGGWQTEEYASENPFKKGEAFDILIVITSDGYKVHVKGQQHCMFKHRIPLEKVTTLHILGNVSISFFGFIMDK